MTAGAEDQRSEEPPAARIRFARSRPPENLPPQLYAEIDLAAQRVLELAAQNRELHFVEGEAGIVVEVRDLDGNVLGVLTTAEALDVISGAELR